VVVPEARVCYAYRLDRKLHGQRVRQHDAGGRLLPAGRDGDPDPALPRRGAGALLVDVPENAPDHEGHIVKNFRHFLVYFNFKIHLVIHAII
jgi:hypothetical protein